MNGNGTTLSFNVCTGASMELTLNSGDTVQDNRDLRIILENEIEKNQSLTRQLDYSQRQHQQERLFNMALLAIRTNLDEIGKKPEASEEYDFLQFLDQQLTTCGFPPRLLPVVTEREAIESEDTEEIPF